MGEDGQTLYGFYDEVPIGTKIKVVWGIPAEKSGIGREVLISRPGDQGVFEGVENGTLYIRRSDGTLENYPLSSIRGLEVLA
jgi:hypothetical protein